MNKESSFLKKFGFHLENLIPISLYDEKEIKKYHHKKIKISETPFDYYSNESMIDFYIYSHEKDTWQFIPQMLEK